MYQGIGVRSLGIGAVQICTEASMRQSPLNPCSGGGGLDCIVRVQLCYAVSIQMADLPTEVELQYIKLSHLYNSNTREQR